MKKSISILLLVINVTIVNGTNYYVNDGSTTSDVYCTAVGASGNNGTSPSTPKALISQVLSTYDIEPNDVIYVDRGTYTDAITFDGGAIGAANDCGSAAGYVKIIGAGAGNTIINNNTAANTIYLNRAYYIWIDGVRLNITSAGGGNTTLYMYSDVNNILITKSIIASSIISGGVSAGDLRYAIGISSASSTMVPSNISVLSNTITANKYAIVCKGHGVGALSERANNVEFSDNLIEVTNPSTSATEHNTIFYFTRNTKILRNRFKDFYTGIFLGANGSTGLNHNIDMIIANNYFTDNTSSSNVHCSIHVKNTLDANSNIKIYNNSFYSHNGSYGCFHGETSSSVLGVTIRNNIFSIPSDGTLGSSVFTFGSNPSANKFAECNYNYYDCSTIGNIVWGGYSDPVDLLEWQSVDHDAGGTNGDVNSRDDLGAPGFVGATSGNLNLTASSPMYSRCPAYNGLANDIWSMGRPISGATPHAFGAYDNGTVFLPVELVFFEASQNLYNNILSWQTASEVNNSHFEIEKSNDAVDFEKIGIVKSKYTYGNSSRYTSYNFNDELSSVYYRLKQVDNDGSYSYSKTVFIDNNQTPSRIKIYPNPSKGKFVIENVFEENEMINIQVYDVFGKLISKETVSSNQSTIELNLANIESGWYFISLEQSGKCYQEKILKFK